MCGIFGNYCFSNTNLDKSQLLEIGKTLSHRGPDHIDVKANNRYALGCARLAIIDISPNSNQPLCAEEDDIVVVQNGEIYNFVELRDELIAEGYLFKSNGDTEVILRAYQKWGAKFVSKINGMFAIAIMDIKKDKLFLFRDRLGVKPLYYAYHADTQTHWFGSEIKTILAAGFSPKPNYDALAQFLALNYIPHPHTAFENIFQVPPASIVEISADKIDISDYWCLSSIQTEADLSYEDAIISIKELLLDATSLRLRSDAQYGAFLSGGLDSSIVVSNMQMLQSESVNTFSMGFDDLRFDESYYASLASEKFSTNHSRINMNADLEYYWPRFIWHADQPHGDVSFMAMDQIAAHASHTVKMVLSGDGGDELFGGYKKYIDFINHYNIDDHSTGFGKSFAVFTSLIDMNKAKDLLSGDLYQAFFDTDPFSALINQVSRAPHQDPINRILFAETTILLPGNNLVKSDKMSMANSLEMRSPFLDYRLAELAFKIPGHFKIKNGVTKSILKNAYLDNLGHELTHRDKQMFTVPIGEWLRGRNMDYCRNILFDGRLASRGLVCIENVERLFHYHISKKFNYTRELRAFVSLEIWFRLFIDKDADLFDRIN